MPLSNRLLTWYAREPPEEPNAGYSWRCFAKVPEFWREFCAILHSVESTKWRDCKLVKTVQYAAQTERLQTLESKVGSASRRLKSNRIKVNAMSLVIVHFFKQKESLWERTSLSNEKFAGNGFKSKLFFKWTKFRVKPFEIVLLKSLEHDR